MSSIFIRLSDVEGESQVFHLTRGPVRGVDSNSFDLTPMYERHGIRFVDEFVKWLSDLNLRFASRKWWAFTSTAKNLLSSPLGNAIVQVLAVEELARTSSASRLVVTGATLGQVQALARRFECRPPFLFLRVKVYSLCVFCTNLTRLAWHMGQILILHACRVKSNLPTAKICLLTYVDEALRDDADTFFGNLADFLVKKTGDHPLHLAVMQGSRLRALKKTRQARKYRYSPLFDELRVADVILAAVETAKLIWGVRHFTRQAKPVAGVDVTPVLTEALRWDLGRGGYFLNLLIYYAIRRFAVRVSPSRLIYPFEMKSLEKMLVLGLRQGAPTCSLVGYQHASITRRHSTFTMGKGEAEITPLPDYVVTVGRVTQRYLAEQGEYPKRFFRVGGALRQSQRPLMKLRPSRTGTLRLLVALSSSRQELTYVTNVMRDLTKARSDIEVGLRPHPEFPLSLLPAKLRESIHGRIKNFSETSLEKNLEWCDAVVYVSSTVALESLMIGKMVIKLKLSDPIDPDPLLGHPPLKIVVSSIQELSGACDDLHRFLSEDRMADRMAAAKYAQSYLSPINPLDINVFLGAHPLEAPDYDGLHGYPDR